MAANVGHAEFFVTGGTVPLSAESYVVRAADKQLLEALLRGKFCYVLNSRQMGKSSLCVRTMANLKEDGVRTALVDLTKIGGRNVTPEQWYAGLISDIGRELNLRPQVLTFWKENAQLSPMQRFFAAAREVALEDDKALVIFIDEIDTTRSLAFNTDEFFAGIRECNNRRAQDPEYNRLTFCLLGVAVPSDLIQDARTTPFNIGEQIYLRDFTLEESMALGEGLGERAALVKRVHYWTNGHPFLTQSLCLAVEKDRGIRSEKDVDALVETELFQPKARKSHINLADVGNRVLNGYADGEDADNYKGDVLSAYGKALKGRQQLADDETNRISAALKLSGLMRSEGKALIVRNRIYERVFGEDWIRENMPGQEVRRQKRAFWLGVLRTAVVSLAVIALIAKLALNNANLAEQANALAAKEQVERDQAQYQAYVADVNAMQMAADSQDSRRLQKLITETATSPFKNFEWRYWNAQLNNSQYTNNFPTGPGFMAIAADGRSCAVEDYRLRKVEILSLPDLRLIEAHSIPKRDVFVWQLGTKWVGAAFDGAWTFDDLRTGTPCGRLSIPGGNLNWISGPPSTNFIAAPWEKPGERGWRHVAIWSASSLQLVKNVSFNFSINGTVSVSSDGRTLAIIEQAGGPKGANQLCAIEVATGRVLDSADLASEYYLNTPRLSLDGSRMAASEDSGLVIVRDIPSHRFVFQKAVGHNLVSLALSSDGREMVTLEGYLCQVWDLATGKTLLRKTGCLSTDLSPDGRFLIDAGVGTRVYQVGIEDVETAPAPDNSVPFRGTSSGRWLLGSVTALRLLDPVSLKTIKTMSFKGVTFRSLTGQGKYILGRGKDDSASVYESESGRLVCRLPKESAGNLGASEEGKVFAREDQDFRKLHVFDSSGREVWNHKLNSASFFDAVSPNGKLVATGLYTGDVDIFDAATGKIVRVLTEPSMCIRALAFSRDSKLLAVGGDEATVFIYYLEKPGPPVECNVNEGGLLFLSFSPDGSRLLATGLNQLASLWDTRTGDEVMTFGDSSSKVNRAMFNQSGDQICTLDEHGVLHVYRAPWIE